MKPIRRGLAPLALLGVLALTVAAGAANPASASGGFIFQKVILKGEAAPGTEPGTIFGPLFDGYLPSVPALDEAGRLSFAATLEGPAVNASNGTGIWSWDLGALSLVARAGMQAPEIEPGGVFASFPFDFALFPPSVGDGRIGFDASLTGPGIDFDNNEGLWSFGSGGSHLIARRGDPAAGFPLGAFYSSQFLNLVINDAGHALVRGSVIGSGITDTNDEAFWTDRGGVLSLLLREGDPAPDTSPGVRFGGAGEFIGTGYSFESVSWSNGSGLAIQGNLTGSGINTFNNEALYLERSGALRLLVREGNSAPGVHPNETFGGNSVTADFGDIVMNSLEQAAFTARVAGNQRTIYVLYSDHTGSLSPV
ncbi:MAG: DUF7453 family protein, partial [Acidimicrobiia bacterium]